MHVLNIGSLNIDIVYRVPHIVHPGETLSSYSVGRHAGGKGLNQSVALAGAAVSVTRHGAAESIPHLHELKDLLSQQI